MAHKGGAKLATRVAMLVSKSMVYTHTRLAVLKHKLAMAVFHSISDVISNEVHDTIGSTFRNMHDNLPDDSPAKPLLQFMAEQVGQLQAVIGMAVGSSGLFTSVSTIMNNELAPIVYEAVGSNPHLIPDASSIAQMVARGQYDYNSGVVDIGKDGLSVGWARMLIQLNTQYPGVADIFDMRRRNLIENAQAMQWMQDQGIDTTAAEAWLALVDVPLSAADAALAYLRGNMTEADATAVAAANGITASDFQVLVNNTGEPLGLEQLLEAYRRGFIDKPTLEKGILESRVRNEWIPTAEQLAYSPMSVADAVNAVVQNQLDLATAEAYAQQNGLEDGQFSILLATAGEPLSRTEMEQLYNRGLVTEQQVTQALSESRLKNKYNDLAFALHTKILDPSVISDAVLHGALDENTALSKAMDIGYSEADSTTLIMAASNAKMYAYREKVIEDIAALYETNAIDETTATGYITSMGWSEAEAALILQASEYARQKRALNSAITGIRSKFIAHHITADVASNSLQSIGVPSGEITYLMNLWTLDEQANVKLLTPTQVISAMTATLFTTDQALTYLTNLGYTTDDANILISLAAPTS